LTLASAFHLSSSIGCYDDDPNDSFTEMRANLAKDFFIWEHLLQDSTGTVIVLPSPHGEYKSGISYSDALAMGEVYANLRKVKDLNVRTPEHLGDDIYKNLVLIGGKKANPIAKAYQAVRETNVIFYLDDGVIYDKENQVILTPTYIEAETRTVQNVTVDYGLITYTENPFGKRTKLLHLAGIKGWGTLAAAIAATEEAYTCKIQKFIKERVTDLAKVSIEVLVKVCASNGKVKRETVSIEKIKLRVGNYVWKSESEAYGQLSKVSPHRLYIAVSSSEGSSWPSTIKVGLDGQEVKFAKSPDRLKTLYILAEQARHDYLKLSESAGWVRSLDLAERLWGIKRSSRFTEIPDELKREISGAIMTWARHLERRGKLKLDQDKLDHAYINSEILVLDSDIKKKIADLVYLLNHEERHKLSPGFHLIESRPGVGYRLNIHPALVFISKTSQSR